MTKKAHITSRPEYVVGDRVLGLCGKEFTVKVKWADLPGSKPICRPCVDQALNALSESDKLIENVRIRFALINSRMGVVHEILGETLVLDEITETDLAFQDELAMREREKAELERAKSTCTCTWETPELFKEDPNCPIHGGELDAIPVELPEGDDA